jgi:hypothetical protein
MFLEIYRRVSIRLDDIEAGLAAFNKLLTRYKAQQAPGGRNTHADSFRRAACDVCRQIMLDVHHLTKDDEEKLLFDNCPRGRVVARQVATMIYSMEQAGHKDLIRCPLCGDQPASESPNPQGPIDRPAMPEAPLEVAGPSLVAYLKLLQPWLQASFDELLEELAPKLPAAPDRYLLGDIAQVRSLAHWLYGLQDLVKAWRHLIDNEGPEWSSWRVGAQRHFVLERVRSLYVAICQPDALETAGTHGLLELLAEQVRKHE